MPSLKFKTVCGICYGFLMLISVMHFEYNSKISNEMRTAIVPYVLVVSLSFIFAYRSSDWYLPSGDEWPNFEYIIAPIKVILASVVLSGLAFGFAISIDQDRFNLTSLLELMGFGALFASGLFVVTNWHILIVGSAIITTFLAWYAKWLLTKSST